MPLVYRLLADATVILHFAYVAFVLFGWLAIARGACCGGGGYGTEPFAACISR